MQHRQEHRSLWYVVIGKPVPSLVHVPFRHKIDDLKKAICEGRGDLCAQNIILWKLNSSISVARGDLSEIDVFTRSLAKIELPDPRSVEAHDAKGVVHVLDESTEVSDHWPENYQQGHLHLIVQDQEQRKFLVDLRFPLSLMIVQLLKDQNSTRWRASALTFGVKTGSKLMERPHLKPSTSHSSTSHN